ncbi:MULTISPECIES: propionate catabolism operon regulatory protein PrpR [Caballeronia]|uniref:Fis family transcriptional regulator n=1 Tax=Caballeronia zhejiangensis TaxID=871203 RepID=A0A656QD17_9BURK|nr:MULTISPECIES: propionate catabolism operon regulatory protein PrpR [Caballeronia]EKS71580.1 propionate catabolism operon regulatory transcription regulator (prpr) [Burkholderia sp. SJ98]KDR26440.1 Fis family transcriptional regulator [Caballeronia zhejiangensis]MDR5790583.1 propionate catabolism operon regulatory protein PrpR [Caballeronia sp. LP003]
MQTETASRPRIWAVGISRLRDLFIDLVDTYAERAELDVVALGFEDAANSIESARDGRPDVVVAGGSNGAYLKSRVSVPVVVISPTGFDVMHALTKARREGASVALVTHGDTPAEIRRFLAVYGIDVICASYRSAQDAENLVLDLRDRGVDVVVGPGLVADLAADAGMSAVFLYSRTSVVAAFETALEVAQAMRREVARRNRLDNLLQHLRDGVVAVDALGRIEAINRRLAAALGIADASRAVGQALLDVAPELDGVLPSADGDVFGAVRGVSYAIHRGPLASDGASGGTIFTFQESRAVERLDRTLRSRQGAQEFVARYRLEDVVGESESIERVRSLVRRYAKSDATVLILGESGTGKEMVAQSMHRLSRRKDFPFVAMNCGAFPEALLESELFGYEEGAFTGARKGGKAGLIEAAHRGTLFLDEIGEMPPSLQSRLLRVLQEREVIRLGSTEPTRVDIRVIAATHRTLAQGVADGSFRADLFYRINILSIALPPLRARSSDVLLLATALLAQAARRDKALASRVPDREAAARVLAPLEDALCRYPWPGNVRELQNIVERIAVELSDRDAPVALALDELEAIAPELFEDKSDANADRSLRDLSRSVEADQVRASLAAFGGDRDAVCKALGISKTTLWRRLNAKPKS